MLLRCWFAVVLLAGLTACVASPREVRIADNDQDGILDRFDRCPYTRSGVSVDAQGCPHDADHDGIFDFHDDCPDSPAEEPVTIRGCPVDEDGDGVADLRDRCAGTPVGVAVDAEGCPRQMVEIPAPEPPPVVVSPRQLELQVTFRTGQAVLEQAFEAEFDRGVAFIRSCPGCSIVIEGHTDNVGPAAYNRKLSRQRADVVRAALIKRLGSAPQIQVAGFGEERPVADNRTQEGRLRNRRVLISISEPRQAKLQ